MSGIKYIFDTNALISFFQGNPGLQHFIFEPIGISIISVLKFLSFPNINAAAKELLFDFLKEVEVFELKKDNEALISIITALRIESKIKLPNAIIAGTAMYNNAILITTDKGFSKIPLLQTAGFN